MVVEQVGDASQALDENASGVWDQRLNQLGVEASTLRVVGVEKVLGGQNTTSQVAEVDSHVGVDTSSVTTKTKRVGVGGVLDSDIRVGLRDVVWVAQGAAVPVVWNALMAWVPLEVGVLALNSKELLQRLAVKVSARLLVGVVAHQVDDEEVGGWCDKNTREWSREEVRVLRNRQLALGQVILRKAVKSVSVVLHASLVQHLEAGQVQAVRISVVDVCVTSGNRHIGFVGVVCIRNSLSLSKKALGELVGWWRSSNRPRSQKNVTVHDDSVRGQESSKARSHAKSSAETLDGLQERGDTAAAQVTVVGSGVKSWARSSNLAWLRSSPGMVAGSRHTLRLLVEDKTWNVTAVASRLAQRSGKSSRGDLALGEFLNREWVCNSLQGEAENRRCVPHLEGVTEDDR